MRSVVLMVLLVVTLSVSGAPAPFPRTTRQVKTDLELLQGSWELVAQSGRVLKKDEKFTLRIASDRMKASQMDLEVADFALKLDPVKTPKHIDLTPLTKNKESGTVQGLYRIDSTMLTLCISHSKADDRPTDFTEKYDVMTFKRLSR